jgi:hypothetical protein
MNQNNILLALLRLLSYYWMRDYWMTDRLQDQRARYQERIKEIKRHD